VQTQARGGSAILAQVERPYERSSLFEWLMAHHDDMVAAAGGRADRVEPSLRRAREACSGEPASEHAFPVFEGRQWAAPRDRGGSGEVKTSGDDG